MPPPRGSVLFDATGLAKNDSCAIAWVRAQYRGNAHAVIQGIGGVTCVDGHPAMDQCWRRDSRLYDPAGDGQSKRDQVRERLPKVVYQQQLPVPAVLMDPWYAIKAFLVFMASFSQIDDCPLKDNRQGDDSGSQPPYRRVEMLVWTAQDVAHGKCIKSKGFPKDDTVPRCRVAVSPHRTDCVGTHDLTQDATKATQEACGCRWKSEPLHRAGQPGTGLERCQCRKARTQRQHLGGAFLVWGRLKELAMHTGRTMYQLQHGLAG